MTLNPDVPVLDVDGVGDVIGVLPSTRATEKDFKIVPQYTTLWAEYRFEGEDILIHFFPTAEVHALANSRQYWMTEFPHIFEQVVFDHFAAQPPRVEAQLVEGVVPSSEEDGSKGTYSWMLRARGFATSLDPDGYTARFIQKLDAALDPIMAALR